MFALKLLLAGVLLLAWDARAQVHIAFSNRAVSDSLGIPQPVLGPNCCRLRAFIFDLSGTNESYHAQLFWGRSNAIESELTPVDESRPFFRSIEGIHGSWIEKSVTISNANPGELLRLQVRVWNKAQYATYEAAVASTNRLNFTGKSAMFDHLYPANLEWPGPSDFVMKNFRGFRLVPAYFPAPPVFKLFVDQDQPRAFTLPSLTVTNRTTGLPASACRGTLRGRLEGTLPNLIYHPPAGETGSDRFEYPWDNLLYDVLEYATVEIEIVSPLRLIPGEMLPIQPGYRYDLFRSSNLSDWQRDNLYGDEFSAFLRGRLDLLGISQPTGYFWVVREPWPSAVGVQGSWPVCDCGLSN